MVKRKFFFQSVLCLIIVILFDALPSFAGNIALSWNAPTTNTDGTPLTDLAGYKIYYGTASLNYSQNINVGNVTTYTVTNLTDGLTYYFAVTAYDSAYNESGYSNEVSKTLSAQSLQHYTLNVTKAGTGTGAVTSSPAGINCGSDCSEVYNSGTSVTLTASPASSSTFAGWSGACTSTGTCTVNMNAAKSVTATFTLRTYTINASAGTGGSISPSGTLLLNYGANQSFTISPNTNYSIANVMVDGNSIGAVTSYTFSNVTANHTISASFAANPANTNTLTVTKAGTGAGTVTSSPAGINCGSDCSEVYNSGTSVTLTVSPDSSSTFAGWSGACSGTGTCTVNMNAAKSVTATFIMKTSAINTTYTITASAGNGGTVFPSGIISVNYGSIQCFTITANTGYSIANIIIDGSSVGAVTSYTFSNIAANHTISAIFKNNDSGQILTAFDLPKTGQTISYFPGDDGFVQAGIEWPNPRFTDNGDGTVQDNLTGLTWLKDGGCLKKKWKDVLQAIANLNANPGAYNCLGYSAGYSDWRLPNIKELETLVNYGESNSAQCLNTGYFQNVKSGYYWSSTSYQTATAWIINMNNGIDMPSSKSKAYYMLPVRTSSVDASYELPKTGQTLSYASGDNGDGSIQAGIEWPSPRFTDNGDGTVQDNLTGLMWLKDGGCLKKKWNGAIQSITDLNANPRSYACLEYSANYSDWRLPNIKELESLVNYGTPDTSAWLNAEGFLNATSSKYWTSTTYLNKANLSWVVNMKKGDMSYSGKKARYRVLPVRGGIKAGNLQ